MCFRSLLEYAATINSWPRRWSGRERGIDAVDPVLLGGRHGAYIFVNRRRRRNDKTHDGQQKQQESNRIILEHRLPGVVVTLKTSGISPTFVPFRKQWRVGLWSIRPILCTQFSHCLGSWFGSPGAELHKPKLTANLRIISRPWTLLVVFRPFLLLLTSFLTTSVPGRWRT